MVQNCLSKIKTFGIKNIADNNAKILTTEKDFLRLSKQDQFNIEFIKLIYLL